VGGGWKSRQNIINNVLLSIYYIRKELRFGVTYITRAGASFPLIIIIIIIIILYTYTHTHIHYIRIDAVAFALYRYLCARTIPVHNTISYKVGKRRFHVSACRQHSKAEKCLSSPCTRAVPADSAGSSCSCTPPSRQQFTPLIIGLGESLSGWG